MDRGSLFNLNETSETTSDVYSRDVESRDSDDVGRIRSAIGPKLVHSHNPQELERQWRFRKELISLVITIIFALVIVGGLLLYAHMQGVTLQKTVNFIKNLAPQEEPVVATEEAAPETPARKKGSRTRGSVAAKKSSTTSDAVSNDIDRVTSLGNTGSVQAPPARVVHPLLLAQVIDSKQRRILEGDNTQSRITVDWSRQTPLWSASMFRKDPPSVAFREGDQTIGDSLRQPQNVNVRQGSGQLIHQVMPGYPLTALQEKIQGAVVLQATVDKEGKVSEVHPVSGPPALVMAAVDAVRQWRYAPYIQGGEPQGFTAEITMDFALTNGTK